MAWRAGHSPATSWSREITRLAVGQFAPSVVAGGLMTIVLVRSAEETLWMLPGLWCILFSQGIFACRRLLPRATTAVAVFYLGAGLVCLATAHGAYALSPWAMGLPFGVGQLLAAAVLYGTLERKMATNNPDTPGAPIPPLTHRAAGSRMKVSSGSSTRRPGWAS